MTPMPADLWVPETTLAILDRAVASHPTHTALVAGDFSMDYRTFGQAVDALAARFVRDGATGQTVVILLRNSMAIAIALFAAQRAGAVSAALNPDYTARELIPMLEDAAPSIVMAHADLTAHVAWLVPKTATLVVVGHDRDFVDELLADTVTGELPAINPESIAVLQFTGGTTGRAKGVELTHRAVATNVAQREAVLPTIFGDERIVGLMPMFHSFAAAMCVHLAAYAAGTLIILPRYRPDWVMDAIARHQATRLPAGPTVFNSLLSFEGLNRQAVSSLRCAYSGSAPLAHDTLQRWEALTDVPVYEGYGQSEAGPVLTYQGPATGHKLGSVGRALPHTRIRIVDPVLSDRELPISVSGEIIAQGPQLMSGYRGQPEATADALRNDWLYTGDIGHLDADGDLFIEDRKKDMVIVGGYNVYPREIDEVLMAHPNVAAAATVGVPDSYRGETLMAFVVTAEGFVVGTDTLLAHCAENLVRYKHPTQIKLVDALPLTAVGKIDKVALRILAVQFKELADVTGAG